MLDSPELDLSYLVVWTSDSASCHVTLGNEPVIDAAVSRWIESAKTRDTLLQLTALNGATYAVLASMITSWLTCTPDTRARQRTIEAALKAEDPASAWQEGT